MYTESFIFAVSINVFIVSMDSFLQKQANNFPKEFIPNIAGYRQFHAMVRTEWCD